MQLSAEHNASMEAGEIVSMQLSAEHSGSMEAVSPERLSSHPNDSQNLVFKHDIWRETHPSPSMSVRSGKGVPSPHSVRQSLFLSLGGVVESERQHTVKQAICWRFSFLSYLHFTMQRAK
jgi:hypothetical protein